MESMESSSRNSFLTLCIVLYCTYPFL